MAGCGWNNPIPALVGGGTTDTERVYRMLKSSVGKGGSARSEDAIEAIWRAAKARTIALALTADERAALQALPHKATDALPYYERLLGISLEAEASDDERRDAARARFTETASIVSNEIEHHLQTVDSRFEVIAFDAAVTTTTNAGRRFQDLAATLPFGGGRKGSRVPNYSTAFIVTARLELDGDAPDAADRLVINEAKRYLAEVLPAWIGLQIVSHVGFRLDIDRLDLTALSP